jgi:transcriptional regulator with XRE-family HTH domain
MAKHRTYSRYTREAGALFGKLIKLGRKERKWTEQELAERTGISRTTLKKIEKGDLSVAIGLVFEAAVLVGIKLFDEERSSLVSHIARADEKLSVLPGAVRKRRKVRIDDDF